ncbi:MAG: hypothetical protein NVS4B7_01470 [Ktedonobacteraceae bacterium]
MRYAVFTDIHANLEALEAVLAKVDELAKEKPIDQFWFLGDLVGYGPNPNECITALRERTDVIIAGNHDWAAVGKIDLEDFSAAARISAEWTAEQLTEEHRTFLINLPERLEIGECTLVHGSPYGPLWEYLTSEVLAERSFQYFSTRYCFIGHTHVPVIFQQPDVISNAPTLPLVEEIFFSDDGDEDENSSISADTDETAELTSIQPDLRLSKKAGHAESAYADSDSGQAISEAEANTKMEASIKATSQSSDNEEAPAEQVNVVDMEDIPVEAPLETKSTVHTADVASAEENVFPQGAGDEGRDEEEMRDNPVAEDITPGTKFEQMPEDEAVEDSSKDDAITSQSAIESVEDRLNSEIEELLTLLGLSESLIQVTNEMSAPPEGHWEAREDYRAIINPGGVGQPRDGDPRAAFMIYDTEEGFEFYRIPYAFNKTQEKIIKAGLPQYLAVRLAYGR